jgi:inosine-uridine nucleoside N-ribohydrolase
VIFIDSDNGMGSPRGDVDDAFAIAALLRASIPIAAIASVGGNTSERRAANNNAVLARLFGYRGPLLRGAECGVRAPSEASRFLAAPREKTLRIAALGPLTNIASALRDGAPATSFENVVVVGGNLSSRGRWPPVWPHEFNLTKDRAASREVFSSAIPLTIFPLDVARTLWIERRDLDALGEPFGSHARRYSARWFRRLRMLKWTGRFPVWDLAAAMYLIAPELFTIVKVNASMPKDGWIDFRRGERLVAVCLQLDRRRVWERFVALL